MSVQDVCAKITPTLQLDNQYSVEVDNLNDLLHALEAYKNFLGIQEGIKTIGQVTSQAYQDYKTAREELKYSPEPADSPFKRGLLIYSKAYSKLENSKLEDSEGAKKVKLYRDAYTTLDKLWNEFLGKLSPKQKGHFLNIIWPQSQTGNSLTRTRNALETAIGNINSKLPTGLKEKLQINAFWFTNPSTDKVPLALSRANNFTLTNCPKYFPKPVEQKQQAKEPVAKPEEKKEPVKEQPSWFEQNVSLTGELRAGYAYTTDGIKENGSLSFWGLFLQLKALLAITPTPNTLISAMYEGTGSYDPNGIYKGVDDYGIVGNDAQVKLFFSARLTERVGLYLEAGYREHFQYVSSDLSPDGEAFISHLGTSVNLSDSWALQAIGTMMYEKATFGEPLKDDKGYDQVRGTVTVGPSLTTGPSFTILNFIVGANEITGDPDKKLKTDEEARKAILGASLLQQLKFDPVTIRLEAAYINYNDSNYFTGQVGAFLQINKYFGLGADCSTQVIDENASLICTLKLRAGYNISAGDNQPLPYSPSTAPLYIGDPLWQR